MSHNVEISGIKVTSVTALENAIKELQAQGKKISLERDAHYRGYNSSQSGQYPLVIKLHDAPWDIALKGNESEGYSFVFDPYANHVRRQVGVEKAAVGIDGNACNLNSPEASIGRLVQLYAVNAAEEDAARQGLSTIRHFDEATQQIELTVSGY